jgi:hypothetical protein
LGGPGLGEDLEAAIGLGVVWRQLAAPVKAAPVEPLKLSLPTKPRAKPRAARKARPKA